VREAALELIADDARAVRRAVVERLEVWLPRFTFVPERVERQAQRESDELLRAQLLALLRAFQTSRRRT
jgi:hypothetical protein